METKVRNVKLSPLFEAGKTYNLETQKEDADGTLKPENNHCWVTWEGFAEHRVFFNDSNGIECSRLDKIWGSEAKSFTNLKDAKKFLDTNLQ